MPPGWKSWQRRRSSSRSHAASRSRAACRTTHSPPPTSSAVARKRRWSGSVASSTVSGAHATVALVAVPDFVEAALRAGRRDAARPALDRFSAWAASVKSHWPQPVAARSRALLADGADAAALFEEALRLHEERPIPLYRARTQLLYGEHIRRNKHRREARPPLLAEFETYERLGARPWADRAATELRTSPESRPWPAGSPSWRRNDRPAAIRPKCTLGRLARCATAPRRAARAHARLRRDPPMSSAGWAGLPGRTRSSH